MASSSSTRALIDVAMGRAAADMVIRHGTWVCVQTGEFIPDTDIAIKNGRIAYIGPNASHTIKSNTLVMDAGSKYLVPGLLDGHMHVESGMITVTEFVRAVVPHGTTAMFIDPHEIANVFGLKGVKLMVDEAARQPIHVWVQMPSCVPSAPGLENPGGAIGPDEVAEAMTWEGIIGLGEMMNYPGVAAGDEKMLAEMEIVRRSGKVIGGHYAAPDLGNAFHAYVAGGAEDDHEGTTLEDAIERVRQGMKPMLRYGSAWHDVAAQAKAITKYKIDSRRILLCTDDSHAATLAQEGHMDRVLRHAIKEGLPPMTAIQMATLNTAEHFGLSREIGMLAPGRWADILIVNEVKEFFAEMVIAKGQIVAERGHLTIDLPAYPYPQWAIESVHLKRPLVANDFRLNVPDELQGADKVKANVIGVIENQAPTRHIKLDVSIKEGQVHADLDNDIAKVAVIERHKGTGNISLGLVQGFGFTRPCAVASTVAHDSHHLIVVGTDDASMAMAANKLAEVGGGQVVVRNGEVISLVELKIAGLMSNQPAEVVAQKAAGLLDGFRACGCKINNPNMQLSLLALVVIPELRISDLGLVNVNRFEFIPLFESA